MEYQVGSHILLEKNENYWNADAVKIKGIKIVFVNDSNTSLQAYQSGEIDATDVIPPEDVYKRQIQDPAARYLPRKRIRYRFHHVPDDHLCGRG